MPRLAIPIERFRFRVVDGEHGVQSRDRKQLPDAVRRRDKRHLATVVFEGCQM